jgi:hypothetical protein
MKYVACESMNPALRFPPQHVNEHAVRSHLTTWYPRHLVAATHLRFGPQSFTGIAQQYPGEHMLQMVTVRPQGSLSIGTQQLEQEAEQPFVRFGHATPC